jgi:hypothetical protein
MEISMSTVASVIARIRVEIEDGSESRWTDANLTTLIGEAVERINHLLIRNEIHFAKSTHSFSTADGTALYDLPTDFLTHESLFRQDTATELTYRTDREWENIVSSAVVVNWRINGTQIQIGNTPNFVISMIMYYWPSIDTSAYATDTTMPWSGRMDIPIKEYVAYRCKNIDEMDLTQDERVLNDIFTAWINTFRTLAPGENQVVGWDSLRVT